MLLSLKDAAKLLGFSTGGLRRIVERSRDKANGHSVTGPTIRFFQPGHGADIKFRREWLDQFIDENTVDPTNATVIQKKAKPKAQNVVKSPDVDYFANLV